MAKRVQNKYKINEFDFCNNQRKLHDSDRTVFVAERFQDKKVALSILINLTD